MAQGKNLVKFSILQQVIMNNEVVYTSPKFNSLRYGEV